MTIQSLDLLLYQCWSSPFPMSCSNCCFLTCIQVSQEADKVIWYSHLFKNFPQFVVIHTVKGFSVANEAEVDVFSGIPLLSPWSKGNLISGSSSFSKPCLYIWNFSVHVLLKPSLKDFEYNLTSMWDDCNCVVVWVFFGTAFLFHYCSFTDCAQNTKKLGGK